MDDWTEMTFEQLSRQLDGGVAYKFEVSEGKVSLKVDGLMGSLKKMGSGKKKH